MINFILNTIIFIGTFTLGYKLGDSFGYNVYNLKNEVEELKYENNKLRYQNKMMKILLKVPTE